jgi:hypothetical protein
MKRNEILGEHKKGIKAVKYNKKPKNPSDEHAKAKEKLKPVKPLEEGRWDRRDAYQRDYDSSVSGFGRKDSLAYQLDGGANDEGWDEEPRHARHTPAADVPHDVYIDGRKWKTFSSASHARNVARKLEAKGKNTTVKPSSTEETAGDPVGTVSSATPDGKVSIKTSTGDEIQTSKDALIPGANGTLQMKPDAAGDTLKPGAKVISTEDAQTLNDMLRIAGLK